MTRHSQYERVETGPGGLKFIRIKSGSKMFFWDAITAIERADTALHTAFSRAFGLAGDDWDVSRIESRIENLEYYLGVLRHELKKRHEKDALKERITALRNTTGRTPEEAEEFLRKADELEKKLNG